MKRFMKLGLISAKLIDMKVALVLGLLMLTCCAAWAAESLVITDSDIVSQVGVKTVYTVLGEDNQSVGEFIHSIEGCRRLGDTSMIETQAHFNGNLAGRAWQILRPDSLEFTQGDRTQVLPLPLEVGKTASFDTTAGAGVIRALQEETITTPGGTFRCLVYTMEENGSPLQKTWFAPGVGTVKSITLKPQRYTLILKELKKPKSATPPPGSIVLVNFDSGNDPNATACPKATWNGFSGGPKKGITTPVVDSTEAALDSARSLRWSYHVEEGVWVQCDIVLTGSFGKFFDLTPYDSVSFYVRGFRPGKCAFMVHGKPVRENDEAWVNIPMDYASEWTKVTMDLGREDLSKLDLRNTRALSLGHLGNADDNGNVIWIDEITCHRK